MRNISSQSPLSKEKVILGGVIVLVVLGGAMLVKRDPTKISLIPQSSDLPSEPAVNFTQFPSWRKHAEFETLFNFYTPDSIEIKTIEEGKSFRVVLPKSPDQPLISMEKLNYADFQKEKMELDNQGEKQFGWTNAYGASVFEYRKNSLTAFLVDKEKKEVIKLFTPEKQHNQLLENIVRTFQSTIKETDIHGPWYVNFTGGYKLRYTADLLLQTDNPFTRNVEWKVQFKDPKKSGTIRMVVSTQYPDGGMPDATRKLKVDGGEASLYQYDELNSGVFWQKDDQYYLLTASADSPNTSQTLNNLMVQMVAGFRYLTQQEQMMEVK